MYNFSLVSVASKGIAKRGGKHLPQVRMVLWEVRDGKNYIIDIKTMSIDYNFHKEVDYMVNECGYTFCPPY